MSTPDAKSVTHHRWDQIPVKGDAWPLQFRGRLDMMAQRLELESNAESLLPIAVRSAHRKVHTPGQSAPNSSALAVPKPLASLQVVLPSYGIQSGRVNGSWKAWSAVRERSRAGPGKLDRFAMVRRKHPQNLRSEVKTTYAEPLNSLF